MTRFLRNKVDGTIYDWNEILAVNPKCEEVTEEQAYPERFAPRERIARAVAEPASGLYLDITETEIDRALGVLEYPPELVRELGRGWPK